MTRHLSCLYLCLVYFFVAVAEAADHEYAPTLHLAKYGQVRGIVDVSEGGKRVYHYKGIRYGRADRFRLAHDPEPWQGVWNATRTRFACPQPGVTLSHDDHHLPQDGTIVSSEDCLYLSVWRPADTRTGRAVAIYIHGGTFQVNIVNMFLLQLFSKFNSLLIDWYAFSKEYASLFGTRRRSWCCN